MAKHHRHYTRQPYDSELEDVRVGINIDDDLSCCDARIRFGLVLNNQTDIYTLNDAAGFGASSYYDCSSCADPLTSRSPLECGGWIYLGQRKL